MYQLQVIDADHYALLSDRNRIKLRDLPPARGRLLDRRGRVLAEERPSYEARLSDDADRVLLSRRIARITVIEPNPEPGVLAAALRAETAA